MNILGLPVEMGAFDLPDDMIIETGRTMDYETLLNYSKTNKRFWFLLRELRTSKFGEYVRTNMRYMSAGGNQTAFIANQEQLYVMGVNEYGQIGLGHRRDTLIPTPIPGFEVVSVSTCELHTAFITEKGQLYVMGYNILGEIGMGYTINVKTPTGVEHLKVIAVSSGGNHTAFITDQGQLYMMGNNVHGQLGLGHIKKEITPTLVKDTIGVEHLKVVAVSAGHFHTAFITEEGQLYAMGDNYHGQLGLGYNNNEHIPTLVGNYNVMAVSAGGNHTAFITDQGQLYVMGDNSSGQLGLGNTFDVNIPTLVEGYGVGQCPPVKVVAVSAGWNHTAFITEQGQLYVMGYNGYGQLGLGHTRNVTIPNPISEIKVIAVSAGRNHTIFATIQGYIYVMGINEYGQLGLGHKNNVFTPTPIS